MTHFPKVFVHCDTFIIAQTHDERSFHPCSDPRMCWTQSPPSLVDSELKTFTSSTVGPSFSALTIFEISPTPRCVVVNNKNTAYAVKKTDAIDILNNRSFIYDCS